MIYLLEIKAEVVLPLEQLSAVVTIVTSTPPIFFSSKNYFPYSPSLCELQCERAIFQRNNNSLSSIGTKKYATKKVFLFSRGDSLLIPPRLRHRHLLPQINSSFKINFCPKRLDSDFNLFPLLSSFESYFS